MLTPPSLTGAITKSWFDSPTCFFAGFQEMPQVPNLCRLQFPKSTIRQRTQLEWTEGDTLQFNHLMANSSQQSTNFAVLAFLQFQFQNRAASLMSYDTNALKTEEAFGKVHPVPQLIQCLWSRPAGDMTTIAPHHFETGMRQSLGKIAVVGQQQQALRVFVQSPDREEPLIRDRDHVDRARTSFRVAVGAEHAFGFVQQEVTESGKSQPFGIEADIVSFRGDGTSRIVDDDPVHRNAAVPNVLFTVAPRVHSGHGEEFLQAHGVRGFTGFTGDFRCVRNDGPARFRDSGCHRSTTGDTRPAGTRSRIGPRWTSRATVRFAGTFYRSTAS